MSKEAMGRLILEASVGQHGDPAKQLADAWAEMASEVERLSTPIDMILHCPACLEQHIDEPEQPPAADLCAGNPEDVWTNPPHRSHLCHNCGFIWRPADVATNGVAQIKTKGKGDSPIEPPASYLRYVRSLMDEHAARIRALESDGERP